MSRRYVADHCRGKPRHVHLRWRVRLFLNSDSQDLQRVEMRALNFRAPQRFLHGAQKRWAWMFLDRDAVMPLDGSTSSLPVLVFQKSLVQLASRMAR